MKRIYISGPITHDPNYMTKFQEAADDIVFSGNWPYNPTCIKLPADIEEEFGKKIAHSEYMTVCLAMLSLCDAIYMLPGWENSKGAKIELAQAIQDGKQVILADVEE